MTEAAARNLYKLMAYKDEYEVARLHADPAFIASLDAQFKHGYKLTYHLAPPTLVNRDPATGEFIKRAYGGWMLNAFRWLRRLKVLRGSRLDIFGKTEERRTERKLIADYIELLDLIIADLTPQNHSAAVGLASVPDEIRGFGHVKEKSIMAADKLKISLLDKFKQSSKETPVDSGSISAITVSSI